MFSLTFPIQLNEWVVGQHRVKRALSVGFYHHMKRVDMAAARASQQSQGLGGSQSADSITYYSSTAGVDSRAGEVVDQMELPDSMKQPK